MQELPHALPLVQMRQHLIGGVHARAIGDSGTPSFAAAPNARKSDAAESAATRTFLRANKLPAIERSVRSAASRRQSLIPLDAERARPADRRYAERVRVSEWAPCLVGAILVACASAPPPPPAVNAPEEHAPDEPPSAAPVASGAAPERSLPPSTRSYDEALSTPEKLDVNDERVHLTDAQLTGPMRGVLTGCRVASNARVTVKTAVQNGRAIGVTVSVRFERPKSARPPSRAAARAEAKATVKIIACVDHAVRAVVWPPSGRRDSFSTEF